MPRRPLAALVVVVMLAAACSSAHSATSSATTSGRSASTSSTIARVPASASAHGVPDFYRPPVPLPHGLPGQLIRVEIVTGVAGVPAGATVWRVLYHSRSIYGADIAESGFVVTPPGPAPAGGFPVLSWAHGTTGAADICAPSLFSFPYPPPDLAHWLASGFAVAATDYEGLGTPGPHPYLIGESEGRSVLDAALAAGHLPGIHTSPVTVLLGHSQGGHAVLFADEIAPRYAPTLRIAGVVAAAPATGLSTIVSVMETSYARFAFGLVLTGMTTWVDVYRDLPAADVFTPGGHDVAEPLVDSMCTGDLETALGARHITPDQLLAPGAPTNPVVIAHAKLNDPGQVRSPAPLLVVQGTADTTVPAFLTDTYVTSQACPDGDTVDYLHVPNASHSGVLTAAAAAIRTWVADRVAGRPAPTTCGRPGDVGTLAP